MVSNTYTTPYYEGLYARKDMVGKINQLSELRSFLTIPGVTIVILTLKILVSQLS